MKNYSPRLFDLYKNDIQSLLKDKLGINNVMQLPKIEKIVLNMGIGDAKDNKNSLSQAIEEMTIITGQRPVVTKARKAISNFKLRIGDPVGVKVTLRGTKMYEFLDRLVNIALPRIKDFRGLSPKGFDKSGNYTFGIKEHIIFPEVNFDKVEKIRGLDITVVIKAQKVEHSYELLKQFNFPFIDKEIN